MNEFYERVLHLMARDVTDIIVRERDGAFHFSVLCNDIFWWGCADAEEVTPETIDQLEQCIDQCKHGDLLYCAQRRGMRPQGAFYKYLDEEEKALFNACGPEREIDIGNPFTEDNEYTYSHSDSKESS